ncbi:MAG: primosomal protein N' [Candidatus Cloacimonetes bacterium 4572_65]|nr:MAG: primosomal protein N' [Candidatus Cloacimonetes bacterium 4572_65]
MKKLIKIIPLEVNEHITLLPVRKPRKIVELTHEQSKVIDDIDAVIDQYMVHLLYGITGSGKTEIYIRIMEKVLASGKNALLLVPEISLTPQAVDRFNSAFGEAIAILHSHLSDRERLQEWKRINGGECRIVIGARSAIFAPLTDLGLIIVDEEHEGSYKQDNTPRYNARDLAVIRGKLTNAPVILGSATPSLESWNNALSGKYKLHKLLKRPAGITLPEVYIIDLKKHKGDILLSEELLKAMKDRLLKKEQIILFQNRRGYSSFLQCKSCGELITCPNCDISMHYHNYTQEVTCHYCGYKKDVPRKCPSCDSYSFLYGAGGTQKLEEQVRGLFPTAKVLRMDSDTTTKKQSYSDMFEAMSEGAIDILIGTQMISKGLDFPNVTLVGVSVYPNLYAQTLCG